MNILVTGGAGFIGSWVAEAYISNGHNVLVIDNLSTGNISNIPQEAEFIECDILDKEYIEKLVMKFRPDVVNHHAAQINVRYSVENPTFDANTNIIGSLNLLEMCRLYRVRRIIFASTGGAIYGNPANLPAAEDTENLPLSHYGTSKLCVESYLDLYHRMYGIDYVSLRYANVYGERQNPYSEAGVVSIFCNNIIRGKPCRVFGDGNQSRDYVYCRDVANANLKSLEASTGIYNIGTATLVSVNDLIDQLRQVTGTHFDVIYDNPRKGDIDKISLDNSKARLSMGWSPGTCFNTGLKNTWQWFSNTGFSKPAD